MAITTPTSWSSSAESNSARADSPKEIIVIPGSRELFARAREGDPDAFPATGPANERPLLVKADLAPSARNGKS